MLDGALEHTLDFVPNFALRRKQAIARGMISGVRYPASTAATDLAALTEAAAAAGKAAMRFYRRGGTTSARVRYKNNDSPVTEADDAADDAARTVLERHFPGVTLLSEEDRHHAGIGTDATLVMDPVDGTRAFIAGRTEWCVSLALMLGGQPIAGVVHAPARDQLMTAAKGQGARLNGALLPRRPAKPRSPMIITGPMRLTETVTPNWPRSDSGETLKALAYRLASVAAGAADVALATQGANHWDIAAAQILLEETGCALRTLAGAEPVYNGPDPVHPALIAAEAGLSTRLIAALAR